MKHKDTTHSIINAAFEVHRVLGFGFLESVYKHALAEELRRRGLLVEPEKKLTVHYKGAEVGIYQADIIVAGEVIVELKCVKRIIPEHLAQVRNYLKATGIPVGLVLNFTEHAVDMRRP